MTEANSNFRIITPESAKEPRIWVEHRRMPGLVLHLVRLKLAYAVLR
jgi:hypothetical protein